MKTPITLALRNWQHTQAIDLPLLRRVIKTLLAEFAHVSQADLGIFLVNASEMTRLNESFLHHAGSTDVITFNYSERKTRNTKRETVLHGEIFICVDEAIIQARKFRTTWQSEIVRYTVHGVLHLLGHDDLKASARREMKRVENGFVGQLARQFDFRRLDKRRKS